MNDNLVVFHSKLYKNKIRSHPASRDETELQLKELAAAWLFICLESRKIKSCSPSALAKKKKENKKPWHRSAIVRGFKISSFFAVD